MNNLSEREIELISAIDLLKSLKILCKINTLRENRVRFAKIQYSGCAVCGSKRHLVIHHLSYKDKQTMLLCNSCHKRVHFGKGLEHLNPVGKKGWKSFKERLTIASDIITCSKEHDLIWMGYRNLIKKIFWIPIKEKEPIDRVFRVVQD